jgi:predicted GIY-YIG superfamily endonuclease
MCHTYVLRSDRVRRFYTGGARDLRARMTLHAEGTVRLACFLSRTSTDKLEGD